MAFTPIKTPAFMLAIVTAMHTRVAMLHASGEFAAAHTVGRVATQAILTSLRLPGRVDYAAQAAHAWALAEAAYRVGAGTLEIESYLQTARHYSALARV